MTFAQECYLKILEAAEVRVRPYMRESGPVRGHTRHLKVYVKRADLEKVKGWGNESFWQHKDSREVMQGESVTKFELPLLMWHVSTDVNAVLRSGLLKWMSSKGGGLGGGTSKMHQGVSLTYSREDAVLIQRELLRTGEISRGDRPFADMIARYAREDGQVYKKDFSAAAADAIETFDRHERARTEKRGYHKYDEAAGSRNDAWHLYLDRRASLGGPENPVIFGQPDAFRKLYPSNVGIFAVKRVDIPNEALIMKHPIGTFMHEIRVYSEVPVHGKMTIRRSVYKHNPLKLTAQKEESCFRG